MSTGSTIYYPEFQEPIPEANGWSPGQRAKKTWCSKWKMGDSFTRRKDSVLFRQARRCSAMVKGESTKVSRVCCDLNKVISDHWEVCVWGEKE